MPRFPDKGLLALARVIAIVAGLVAILVLFDPPALVWIGASLVIGSVALPYALNTDPEDLFDDGLEGGLGMTWPILALGLVLLLGYGIVRMT